MQEKSSEFLSYDPKKAILTATFGSFELVKEYFGENKITLTLSDKEGASREYEISLFLAEGISDKKEEIEEEVITEIIESDIDPVTAKIESISSLGEMLLRFNTPMKNETVNTTYINSTVVDIYINPA